MDNFPLSTLELNQIYQPTQFDDADDYLSDDETEIETYTLSYIQNANTTEDLLNALTDDYKQLKTIDACLLTEFLIKHSTFNTIESDLIELFYLTAKTSLQHPYEVYLHLKYKFVENREVEIRNTVRAMLVLKNLELNDLKMKYQQLLFSESDSLSSDSELEYGFDFSNFDSKADREFDLKFYNPTKFNSSAISETKSWHGSKQKNLSPTCDPTPLQNYSGLSNSITI